MRPAKTKQWAFLPVAFLVVLLVVLLGRLLSIRRKRWYGLTRPRPTAEKDYEKDYEKGYDHEWDGTDRRHVD